jgi:hypothetical protein
MTRSKLDRWIERDRPEPMEPTVTPCPDCGTDLADHDQIETELPDGGVLVQGVCPPPTSPHPARAALLAYMADHHEERRDWRDWLTDRTCDEMGCMICNGDTDEETADLWLMVVDDGYPLPDLSDYGYEDPDDAR